MALVDQTTRITTNTARRFAPIWQQLLIIPEAPVLLALLLIGWAFGFGIVLSGVMFLLIAVFVIRVGLLTTATRQLHDGGYERVDKLLNVALRLNPWSVDALQLQAEAHAMRGDDAAAELVLRRAAQFASSEHVVHAHLSAALAAQGHLPIAQQLIAPIHELAPTSPYCLHQMAWYALHVEHDACRARYLLQQAHPRQQPPAVALGLLVTLTEAELALQNTLAAVELLETITEYLPHCSRPQQAEGHYHLGRLYAQLGSDGQTHFRRSVSLDPKGRYAYAAWRGALGQA